jgi:single-strand DNA-binding protein
MLNRTTLIGRVGADPEIREFDGRKVANFNLATTERGFTTKEGREIPEKTEWHKVTVWGGLAKVVDGYVKKGSQVYVEGKTRTSSYEKDGVKHYSTFLDCENLVLLGGKLQADEQRTVNVSGQNLPVSSQSVGDIQPEDDLPF